MAAREIVRVLTIKNRTEGAQEVARDLNEVKRAADGVVQASERTERATLSNSRAFDRLQRSVDPAYRSHRQFQSAIQTLSRAVEQSNTSLSEANRLAAMAATRYGIAADEVRDLASAQMMLDRGYIASNNSLSSANDNIRRSSVNVGTLAAQFQDVGVSAAMGMGAMQIALQQGTQLSAELGPMGAAGAVKSLGAAFLSVISPISLATIAIVGVVAAGLQMVDWTSVAQMSLNGVAVALEVIGPYAAMAAAGLALLYAPQIIGGLVGVIALLGRVSVAAITAAATIAAANPGAAIVLGLTAAVAAANIFRDELDQIFGVDIVGAAKDGVNSIIGAFVGGYNYVKTTWEDLPTLFSAIGKQAYNNLLDELSKPLLTFGDTTIIPGLPTGAVRAELTTEELAVMAGASGTMGDAMGRDYVGEIGGAASRAASGAADKMRELAAGIGGVEDAAAAAGSAAKDAGSAIGAAANDNIDPWKGLRGAVETVNKGMSFARDIAGGFVSDLRNGLKNGEGFWKAFADAASNALDKIIDKLLNEVLDAIFKVNNSASGTGGGGGFLSSIFGGLFGGGNQWAIAAGGDIGLYDSGGWTGSGNPSSVAGLVHREEFVVKAGPAARYRPMLEAINNNQPVAASGGGTSVVELRMSRDVEARILSQAEGQSVRISRAEADAAVQDYDEFRRADYAVGNNPA